MERNYPLDINLGGKEHKTVHFPVFIMNHVAVLPPEKWPQGIFVNWWVTGKGGKISKSKGGAQPIPQAIEKYGVDAMRLYYAHIGSPHIDVVWEENVVLNYKNALERIYHLFEQLNSLDGSKKQIDKWLTSRFNENLQKINQTMVSYDLRELSSITYYSIYDDLKWYLRRDGKNKVVINKIISKWIKLMNPITPHLSEELNEKIKGEKLSSNSSWPLLKIEKISSTAEAGEELVKIAMEGMRKVLQLAKLEKPNKFTLFISEKWQYELYEIISREIKVTRNVGEIMRKILEQEKMKVKGKEVSKIVQSVVKDISKLPKIITYQEEEMKTIQEAKQFLEKEFNCSIKIINGNESDHPKAKSAMPGKVGILVE